MLLTLINDGSEVLQVYSKPTMQEDTLSSTDLEVNIFISRLTPINSSDIEPLSPTKNEVIQRLCELSSGLPFSELRHSEILVNEVENIDDNISPQIRSILRIMSLLKNPRESV